MIKLSNAQDAIKQAIEGGWNEHTATFDFQDGSEPVVIDEVAFTDSLFWQSLGRARRWLEIDNEESADWMFWSGLWFFNRMSGGDETKFWESLP